MNAPEVAEVEEWQKNVVLILDEMHGREDLVYDKHTDALVGFANLGNINQHLQQFAQSLQGDNITEPLAKFTLVLMIQGQFTYLQFQFPRVTLAGHHIFDLFWEAVHKLKRYTRKVTAVQLLWYMNFKMVYLGTGREQV